MTKGENINAERAGEPFFNITATGKSATQEKIEKCEAYAKENNLEIVNEKPEGWRELNGVYCPHGSVVITNRKSFRDKNYTRKLWIY